MTGGLGVQGLANLNLSYSVPVQFFFGAPQRPTGGLGIKGLSVIIIGYLNPLQEYYWQESTRAKKWREGARMLSWQEPQRLFNWEAPNMSILQKRTGEVRNYLMDFSQMPEIVGGDSISSVTSVSASTSTVGAASTDLTISAISVYSTTGAQCKISGGIQNAMYQIMFTVLTAAGYTLVGIGYLWTDNR